MKALFSLVPFTLFALANCGEDSSRPGSLVPAGGDTTTPAVSGQAKVCRATCTTANDCGQSGPLQDASHFACNAGRCEWLGCQSPAECTSALQSNAVTCAVPPGQKVPVCMGTCQAATDCAAQGNALGTAEHFACEEGKCRWTGCKQTSECTAALGTAKTICEKPNGEETAMCVPTCEKAADCAIPGASMSDVNHFACKAGRCEWLGCKSTTECAAALHTTKVVCE